MLDLENTDMTPDEIEAQIRLEEEAMIEKLEVFGQQIAKKRDDAISGRVSSGIENDWVEDEEFYNGIDDANRGEASSGSSKPSANGSSTSRKSGSTRSTVFLNITRPYVDAASAKVADMLLPTDDKNWGIRPTPIPELADSSMDETPVSMGGMQLMNNQAPEGPRQATVGDLAKKVLEKANKQAEAAEKRIDDWLIECQYNAEVRKVIEDCSKLGTGVLKGPFPSKVTRRSTSMGPGGVALVLQSSINPASKRVDPWNFYPDPACGESIHNGQYVFEKDEITAKQLKELKGTPGYIDSQIELVLEEGPGKKNTNSLRLNQATATDKEKFEIWYYHGIVSGEDLILAGVEDIDGSESAHALITLVNDRVIKAALQPLEGGEFPYDVMPWQRRPNLPYGMGVARQIRTPQRIVNAGTRNMMDNAGISAGGQIVMRRGAVEPADGSWNITPRKLWYVKDDADIRSVQDAFAIINLPSMQQDLMNIIQFAMKMAEDVTGLPALLQGQQGKAPETVGGMNMLMNNASSVLRRIARTFDDCITEPHIRRYYNWLMEYGEDDSEKGDFVIEARGSTALVERDLANQAIINLAQMVMNPAFGLDPELYAEELLRAQKLDPSRFKLSEEKKAELAQQPPPVAPQIEVAKIRAQTEMQKASMQNQTKQIEIKTDTDRDVAWVQAETERTRVEHDLRMRELVLKRELEMLRYANEQKIALDSVKAQLAAKAADIQLERDLAGATNALEASKQPPLEPAGRAPNGAAWAQ